MRVRPGLNKVVRIPVAITYVLGMLALALAFAAVAFGMLALSCLPRQDSARLQRELDYRLDRPKPQEVSITRTSPPDWQPIVRYSDCFRERG